MDTRTGAGAGGRPAGCEDADRLQAEGQRLYAEEQRLWEERAAGAVDWEAHRRFAAALRAHQEQVRRFRAGR